MTRLLFAILSLTIIAQSALAQFAADSGKETRNSVVFQNPAETETQPESDLFRNRNLCQNRKRRQVNRFACSVPEMLKS